MAITFFFRGLLIGLSIAAVVGPMSILCMHRTLTKGRLYGLISGLGIATADSVYGSIAAFGITIITAFLVSEQAWIRGLGGLFLIYLGLKTLLSKPAKRAADAAGANTFLSAYASTFLLTLTNPSTLLSFAAIFAGLGVGTTGNSILSAILVVLGVFLGSTLWWLILTGGISLLRNKFTPQWLLWINRLSGVILALFGLIALLSLHW